MTGSYNLVYYFIDDNGLDPMEQNHPVVHPSHVTANLLPNCLRRRMRRLGFYLKVSR